MANKELPPEETKGRVIPVIGNKPRFIPTLTVNWKKISVKIPAPKSRPN